MKRAVICAVAGLLATACGNDVPHISGTVHGMWDGVDGVTLHLMSDTVDTLLTVTRNGEFRFPQGLAVGTSYYVVIASNPIDHTCQIVGGGNGVTDSDDASLEVACVGPSASIDFGGRGFGAFDPALDQQKIPASPFAARATLTFHAAAGITAQLFDQPAPLDTPLDRQLEIGSNSVVVTFSAPHGLSRTFTIDVDRGALPVSQNVYAKASEAARYFGSALSLDGDTLAVAAASFPGAALAEPGKVFVFVRHGEAWEQQAEILAPAHEDAISFGTSVAVRGDTLAISGATAAHVYTRHDGVWTESAALSPSTGARLGGPVALDKSSGLLVAAAPLNTVDGAIGAGEVYVFRGSDSSWTQQTVLVSDQPTTNQRFGSTLAVEYGTISVSAGFLEPQTVYVFREDPQMPLGAWALEQAIQGPSHSGFGASLALSDGKLVIGAPADQSFGAVYIYVRRVEGGWGLVYTLKPPTEGSTADFGASVALSGTLLAVGAPLDSSAPATGKYDPAFVHTGAVLLFGLSFGTWRQIGLHKASNPGDTDVFGGSVALSSDTLFVGAPLEDGPGAGVNAGSQETNTAGDTGALYMFR